MSVYNISSVIEFYALYYFGEEKNIYWDTYLALCKAYGIPPDWEKLLEDGETEKSSSIYESYRRTFQEPLTQFHYEVCYGDWKPFGARMFQLRAEILALTKEKLLEMDKLFFKEVFETDTEKTFTEDEMISRFNMPSSEARTEYFAENLMLCHHCRLKDCTQQDMA